MPLALSQDERILLHLARHQRFREEWEVPAEACQEGIGTRLGILVNNVSRALAGLLGEGLVEERLAHVRGRPRRLKAYFLTEKGLRTVEQVERRLRAAKVDVELEGTRKEVALGAVEEHVVRVVGRRPDLLALADAVREGKTRDADLRAATGGEVAPARPTFAESLAGMPTVERFVGRTAELAAIASALEDRGRAAVVLWGMAGIGKSTLAARAVELRRGRAHLLWHRCTEWDTFRGLVAAVSGLLQESGRTRLAAARRQRWSGQSELLAPLVADFRELPLVLVFDDVHRLPADAAPFLAIALEAARNSSTHVVLVSRTLPAVYGRGDAAPGGPVVEVEVGHLTAEEARSLLPDLSPEDYVRLYAASRGHPLFLRLLASGGAVTEDLTRFIELEI
ncbi:MAG TPA: ATP-binding protein, partial [Thermoplasmata archaeon]|nr:ATP-binding protein [Thermoplasmata archaeon]